MAKGKTKFVLSVATPERLQAAKETPIMEEEEELSLDEQERQLMAQIEAAAGKTPSNIVVTPKEDIKPKQRKKSEVVYADGGGPSKPRNHNSTPKGERPWILEITSAFKNRGYVIDEYHEDYRLDITSMDGISHWRVCVMELLDDKFSMSAFFDFSTGNITRKIASIEYIAGEDKVKAIEWLINTMMTFTKEKHPKAKQEQPAKVELPWHTEEEEEVAEEE